MTIAYVDPLRIAGLLEQLGAQDERFRRAAAMLRGLPAGRPAVDDAALLAEADWLLSQGIAKTRSAAFTRVAGTVTDSPASRKSIAERLRRKHAAYENTST